MFSPTTMASSTTMPSTTMKAKREIRLIVTSKVGISRMAPRKETGIPRATQPASLRRRKRARTRNTSTNPVRPLRSSRESRSRRILLSSCQVVSRMPSGSRGWVSSTYCFTRSEMARALWSPTRNTFTMTAGSPSKRADWSVSAKPSTTVATSPMRRRVPSGRVVSGSAANSAPRYACPSVRSRISPPSVSRLPPGRSSEARRMAEATRSKVSPYRRSASSEISIAISYGRAMARSTWVISGRAERSSRTRSPIRLSVRWSAGPDTATLMTCRRITTSVMTGSSASSGNVSMASTRVLTSPRSFWTSASGSSSTVTVPAFSAAEERISSIPWRSCTASSTRTTTPSSTSSGAAPG